MSNLQKLLWLYYFISGKWHLGWDLDTYGDQLQGPPTHGFNYSFVLPFTLVEGLEMDEYFFTFQGRSFFKGLFYKITTNVHYVVLAYVFGSMLYKKFGILKLFGIMVLLSLTWLGLEHFALPNSLIW